MADVKKKSNLIGYVLAWVAYIGAFLTRVSNIGNVIRDSFSDIHPPEKNEYIQ